MRLNKSTLQHKTVAYMKWCFHLCKFILSISVSIIILFVMQLLRNQQRNYFAKLSFTKMWIVNN